jgi:hypothetical protein
MRNISSRNLRPADIMKYLLVLLLASYSLFAQQPIAIVRGTLIDGTGAPPLQNSVITIEGKKIIVVGTVENTPIPGDANVIDATGKYIIPGLIDCHIHYEQPRDLVQLLAWGVTSVNCMFESTDQAREMRLRTAVDTIHSPQIRPTAPIFTCKQGWWDQGFPIDSTIDRFPETPRDAQIQVRTAWERDLLKVKIMYDDMSWCRDPLPKFAKMSPEIKDAIINEAIRHNMICEVHAPRFKDAVDVLRTPVPAMLPQGDGYSSPTGYLAFAHGIIDADIDPKFVKDMLLSQSWYIPTFCVYEFLADVQGFMKHALDDPRIRSALPDNVLKEYSNEEYYKRYRERYPNISFVKSHLEVLRRNLMKLHDRKVLVAMGTDMWALPGIGAHLELEYMVNAGMTPMEALVCATKNGGQFISNGGRSLGTIQQGTSGEAARWPDLLILDANPLEDIRNTRSVRTIIKRGQIFDHRKLIEESKR